MENDVNGNGVGVRSVNSRRLNQIGDESTQRPVTPPRESIREIPPDKLKEMRSGNRGNFAPTNTAGGSRLIQRFWLRHRNVFDSFENKGIGESDLTHHPPQLF